MAAVLRLLDNIQRGADLRATAREVRDALGAFLPADWLGLHDNDADSRSVQLREQFPELPSQGIEVAQQTDLQRSEEHTSELQSLMRISYAVFCLKKKKTNPSSNIN